MLVAHFGGHLLGWWIFLHRAAIFWGGGFLLKCVADFWDGGFFGGVADFFGLGGGFFCKAVAEFVGHDFLGWWIFEKRWWMMGSAGTAMDFVFRSGDCEQTGENWGGGGWEIFSRPLDAPSNLSFGLTWSSTWPPTWLQLGPQNRSKSHKKSM